MATKFSVPIPQEPIGECFVWRDWLQRLGSNVAGITSISGVYPISVTQDTQTPQVSMSKATATTDGWLSYSDFIAFSSASGATSSFTGTCTGFTTTITKVITATVVGKLVTLEIPSIVGTSNATTFTITGGTTAIMPVSGAKTVLAPVENNGIYSIGMLSIGITGVITLYPDITNSPFTASGEKGMAAISVSYSLL